MTEEKGASQDLRLDIERIQREAAQEIANIKINADTKVSGLTAKLSFLDSELSDRNVQIDELHDERSSIRTLTKIQLSLLKSRIVKRYKKIVERQKN